MDKRLKTISISILLVTSLIAIIDILFYKSHLFGTEQQFLVGDYLMGTWGLFSKLAIGLILVFSFLYYYYYHRDISETLAIAVGSYLMWMFAGISDLLFFLFQLKLPGDMPWLNSHLFVGNIGMMLGGVNLISLIISIILGGTIVYFIITKLRFKF